MNFFQEIETSEAFILESQGNTLLGSDKKGYAIAQRGGDTKYEHIKDKDGNKIKINNPNFTISSAERINSQNLIAITEENGNLTTWKMDKRWQFKKELSSSSPSTNEYIEEQFKFNQSFGQSLNDETSSLSNFWASEPEAGRLWGFYNNGQYTGAKPGSDARIFETFSKWNYPTSGIPSDTKNKDVIAVLDSGINYNHEELTRNMYVNQGEIYNNGIDDDRNGFVDDVIGFDFTKNKPMPWDSDGHGTHVAGTIGAEVNNRGVIGSNPTAKILGVKVLGSNGGTTSDILEGFNYAVLRGAKIINMSLGGPGYSNAMRKAITRAGTKHDVITVAAAGNESSDNDQSPIYPASYTSFALVSVASSDTTDLHSEFSNWGKISVDLHAPGEGIFSPYKGGESSYAYANGTSQAAPLVSGIISSYWSRNPSQKAKTVTKRLLQTVDDIGYGDYTVTGGRVNMARFMGYSTNSTQNENAEPAKRDVITPQSAQPTPKRVAQIINNIANSRRQVKELEITDSVIIDFKGDLGASEVVLDKIQQKLGKRSEGRWTGELKVLKTFDNDLAILDFNSDIGTDKRERICNWLFKNDLVESLETDNTYYAI